MTFTLQETEGHDLLKQNINWLDPVSKYKSRIAKKMDVYMKLWIKLEKNIMPCFKR